MKQLIFSVFLMFSTLALQAQANIAPSSQHSGVSNTQKTTASSKKLTVKETNNRKKHTVARKEAALVTASGVAVHQSAAALSPRELNDAELMLAQRVYTGRISCKSNMHVNITPDSQHPGHFLVTGNGFGFHMAPVATTTGVVRLEDVSAGAVWLQIANKSMLMNQKQGKRLADDCMHHEQLLVAESIKKNPPKNLLEQRK